MGVELDILGRLHGRSTSAKAVNFNYYDIPNFTKDSKAKKKEREEAAKVSKCIFCQTPHAEMGSSPGNDTHFDPCVRCLRHLLIFNLPFPQRKQIAKNLEGEESYLDIYVGLSFKF
jgi:hypothetical protein